MRILELYDGENTSYFISDTNHQYLDQRELIEELRQPHNERYEMHSLGIIDYDTYGELSELTDEQMDEYFWGMVSGTIPKEKQEEIFELFWRNSDEFWN